MDLLNKLTIKNLKLNKKRTIVTIIGIMLSVALITAVATMYSSMIKSLINFEIYEKGDYHVSYYKVPIEDVDRIKNIREIENVFLTSDLGYAKLENSNNEFKPYIFVKSFTSDSLKELAIKVVDGRLPKNENEIVIPTHLKTNGRVSYKVGDTLTLEIGTRISSDGGVLDQNYQFSKDNNEQIINTTTRQYKIVGIVERPTYSIEGYSAPGYTFITYMNDKNINNFVDVYTKYSKKGLKEYTKLTANVLGVDEKLYEKFNSDKISAEEKVKLLDKLNLEKTYQIDMNSYLISLETSPLNNDTVGSLGVVVAIVIGIILITSILCIKNSFDISITEKIKQYGMLRSIGATKKQIKNNVFYEATILGIIGIPLGLLLGFLASYILVIICNILLSDMVKSGLEILLSYSWVSFLISVLLGIITIYVSAFRCAKKASKVSPIELIRNSNNIKINFKKIKCPKLINKLFGIGGEISYKNLKRNKKKYRTTIISIIVSVAIFIALSFFISSAFKVTKNELKLKDYNISMTKYDSTKEFEEKVKNVVKYDNINNYSIILETGVDIKAPKYNEEIKKYIGYNDNSENGFINIVTIDDYQYKKYLKELKLDYQEYQTKGILVDRKEFIYEDKNGKNKSKVAREFSYQAGDFINAYSIDDNKYDIAFEIGYITGKLPFGKKYTYSILIVSNSEFEKIREYEPCDLNVYFDSSNASKLQDDIEYNLNGEYSSLDNIEENVRIMNNLYTLVAIFLYGFIIVISLIGITNIFNTITTNMELRKQEFAMLKSIGMTSHEFNNMIRLESIFMGFKALVFGIFIGTILSYLLYIALDMRESEVFVPPIFAIVLSIIVVYLLITVLMKYSMNKINKQNTIETIRNENI